MKLEATENLCFTGIKSSAKLVVANNAHNLEKLDSVLLFPRDTKAANGVNTDSAKRKAEPHGSSPTSNSLRCLSFDCNFQLLPSQADIARCYKSQHRWGLRKRAEEDFSGLSHHPLQNTTKPQFYPQCNLRNYSKTRFSAVKG